MIVYRGGMNMRIIFGFVCVMLFCGCVEMRDYVGVKEGHLGLDIERGFGEGKSVKDYYALGNGEGLVIRDRKEAVISKIGNPDHRECTLEGLEAWTYKERNLRLLFDGDFLNGWEELPQA